MPSCAAPTGVPWGSATLPSVRSSPRRRKFFPASRSLRIRTRSSPASVSSTRITLSAPSGSGAPVMIRVASPFPSTRDGKAPAATDSITGSSTGAVSLAPRTSSARTA